MEHWSWQALSPTYVELTFQLKRGTEILSYLYKQTNLLIQTVRNNLNSVSKSVNIFVTNNFLNVIIY